MKKFSLFVVLCFLYFTSFSQNSNVMADNMKVYKAIETGDVSGIKNYIDKDAVDHEGGANGQDVVGGDSILAMLATIHNSFAGDLKTEVISSAMSGDYIFTLVRMTGTTTATPGMGMPANKQIDSKSVDVVKIKNGKAIEHWDFIDPKDMMSMMSGQNK